MQTISAKDRFKQGYILTLRPFDFADISRPIQKFEIYWAYSERPVVQTILTLEGKEKIEDIYYQINPLSLLTQETREEELNRKINIIMSDRKYLTEDYSGEIVQCMVEGKMVRMYPDEYRVLSKEKLTELMQEEGYHTVVSGELKNVKAFRDSVHYLTSRGIPQGVAEKWSSLGYGDLVYFKPYYELLKMFSRDHEIYADKFYEEKEGVAFEDQLKWYKQGVSNLRPTNFFSAK